MARERCEEMQRCRQYGALSFTHVSKSGVARVSENESRVASVSATSAEGLFDDTDELRKEAGVRQEEKRGRSSAGSARHSMVEARRERVV